MRPSHSPESSSPVEERDFICFFPVRGPAFTSLKVGVGHRLDVRASGVLGRCCGEPGGAVVQARGGGYWGDTGSPATFSLSAVSHHCAPSIPAPSLTSWWKGGSHSRPPLSTAPSVCRVYEAVCAHVFTLVTFLGRYCMILWEKISFHKLS